MKKIRDGCLYDTDTATLLGEYHENDRGEKLYRKTNGQYFKVVSSTGPWDRDMFIPLSREEAKEWAEEGMSVDA